MSRVERVLGSGIGGYQVAFGESLNLSEPYFPQLQTGDESTPPMDLEDPVKFGM